MIEHTIWQYVDVPHAANRLVYAFDYFLEIADAINEWLVTFKLIIILIEMIAYKRMHMYRGGDMTRRIALRYLVLLLSALESTK